MTIFLIALMVVLYLAVLIYFGGIIIQKDMIRRRRNERK